MKKLTALILTLVMLVSMTAIVPVSADANVIVATPNKTAITLAAGTSTTITWDVNEDAVFASFDYRINFDQDALSVAKTGDFKVYNNEMSDYLMGTKLHNEPYGAGAAFTCPHDNIPAIFESDFDGEAVTPFASLKIKAETTAINGTYPVEFSWGIVADYDTNKLTTVDSEIVYITITGGVDPAPAIKEDVTNLKADAYQIRVPHSGAEETTFGFRFISEVDVTNYTNVKSYGTLVIPAAKLTGDLTVDTADVENVVAAKFMEGTTETFKQFNATMVDIKDANYAIDFTYRPYIVLEDDSIVYGEVATANIINTIKGLYNDLNDEQKAFVEALPGYNA